VALPLYHRNPRRLIRGRNQRRRPNPYHRPNHRRRPIGRNLGKGACDPIINRPQNRRLDFGTVAPHSPWPKYLKPVAGQRPYTNPENHRQHNAQKPRKGARCPRARPPAPASPFNPAGSNRPDLPQPPKCPKTHARPRCKNVANPPLPSGHSPKPAKRPPVPSPPKPSALATRGGGTTIRARPPPRLNGSRAFRRDHPFDQFAKPHRPRIQP
jgi:hypothetical protein